MCTPHTDTGPCEQNTRMFSTVKKVKEKCLGFVASVYKKLMGTIVILLVGHIMCIVGGGGGGGGGGADSQSIFINKISVAL